MVGAITPWNSPLLLMTFKLAPGLAAGCTFVVKPSEHSPASTLAFAQVLHEAGFPDGRVQRRRGLEPRARRRAGGAQGRRQGRVHRLDRDRPRGRARRRGQRQPGDAGAGRQVAADRLRGRRPARGGQRDHRRRLRRHRPDLHGRLAGDRARERARRAGAPGRRARERDQARRPERPRDRDGPDREPAAVREGARLPRQGQRPRARRRRAAARRRATSAGSSSSRRCSPGRPPTTPSCARRSSAR